IIKDTEVTEHAATQAEFLGQAGGERKLDLAAGIAVAAKGVIRRAGKITRANAGVFKAAQAVTTQIETVVDAHILAKAVDVTAFAEQRHDPLLVFIHRDVGARTQT